ncbi:MAG: SPFH domain-containing protein, partial [Prevotellaceae bacterium]|nr:SPFH domain-containing protein [Prevotellaceae bacterium]
MKINEVKFEGLKLRGIPMLIFNILLLIVSCWVFVWAVSTDLPTALKTILIVVSCVLFSLNCLFWNGFMEIEPNDARVMIFFGKYEGTIKENGYFWVNPFYSKKRLTLRARNLDAEPIKVNDKAGNPVLIGQIIVWRVVDTYKASFHIDNASKSVVSTQQKADNVGDKMKSYEYFVKVQSDAALRYVAGMYTYDQTEDVNAKITLRSGGEEINEILEKQINERLSIAGIEVIEARINYLAYAPEIAAVMLRRQQADA